jgi:hypothetical protein
MSDDPLMMRDGESPEEYLVRLESLDGTAQGVDGQLALALSIALARKRISRAAEADISARYFALGRCKQAIRSLSPPERKQLAVWLAKGMLD